MSTATIEKTRPEVFNRPAEFQGSFTPVTPAGDWLNIEREPLLRLQPEAAPVAVASATERAVAAGHELPSSPGCPAVIVEAFGERAPEACAVAWCESRWDPDATGAAGERGLFQVHPAWHPDATYDVAGNVAAAYRISSGGRDWSAWSCRWAIP